MSYKQLCVNIALAVALASCLSSCKSTMMKGTPLYSGEYSKQHGPPEERVNVWPLLYYHDPALSVLWPVGENTDDHFALRPLFSVYKLDRERHEWNVLWPLIESDRDTHDYRVFPVFWGGQKKEHYDNRYFVTFPLVWHMEDWGGVLPLFWWDDGFTVFPLGWYERDEYCHLLPLWLHSKVGEEGHDTHALWPIFRWKDTEEEKGFRIWPLLGAYSEGKKDHYRYALWPLCQDIREGDKRTSFAAPFYFRQKAGDYGWWVVVPLAFNKTTGDGSLTITPLTAAGKKKDANWHMTVPFYYYSNDTSKNTQRLITPLFGRIKSPDKTNWMFIPLLSSYAWGEGEKDLWMLGPTAHARWGDGELQHHVFPFYYYDRNEKLFLSPLASWTSSADDDRGFFNLLVWLMNYHNDGRGRKRVDVLPPLTGFSWRHRTTKHGAREYNSSHVLPLYWWSRRYVERSATESKEEGGRSSSQSRSELWTFPWFWSEKSRNVSTTAEEATEETVSANNSLFPIWGYRTSQTTGEVERDRTDFNILGWLYDYKRRIGPPRRQISSMKQQQTADGATSYVRSRILWRLMHYEREDKDVTLDVFPFVTWDSKADGYRQFSFLWRFFRYARDGDGERDLDLLFIPLMRGTEDE